MFELNDTFNGRTISRHRTLRAACEAAIRHGRAVARNNGADSYIPTSITDMKSHESYNGCTVENPHGALADQSILVNCYYRGESYQITI